MTPAPISRSADACPWWASHPPRIYHPNAREFEHRNLDVARFVSDCLRTEAEAIVVSAAGIYAFYPTDVPFHVVSAVVGSAIVACRDLLGEIVEESHRRGLLVIARADFSRARVPVAEAHPEWFQRGADGTLIGAGEYRRSCPMGGYQREAFALPVLRELFTRYALDGLHLNATGFGGICHCEACRASFGDEIPLRPSPGEEHWSRYVAWRQRMLAQQMVLYREAIHALAPEALLMAELAGEESPNWLEGSGQHLPSLSAVFTNLLVSCGGVASARSSPYWVSLAAEQMRALAPNSFGIANLKLQMRDRHRPHALVPPAELERTAYQSLAHGAGLKLPTFGIPEHQQEQVLGTCEPIQPIAMLWPERALGALGRTSPQAAALLDEGLGLWEALAARHVLVGLLYDEQITPERLDSYNAVVLPSVAWLKEAEVEVLIAFARRGGRLVISDPALPGACGAELPPTSPMLLEAIDATGGLQSARGEEARVAPYALATLGELTPPLLGRIGPLAMFTPHRRLRPGLESDVWLWSADTDPDYVPEDLAALRPGMDPIVIHHALGDGHLLWATTGLGQWCRALWHGDVLDLIETLVRHGAPLAQRLRTNAPSSVEITLSHWVDGVVVHLVNNAGPLPLAEPAPIGPIELDLAWDGPAVAQLCVPGAAPTPLPCQELWNRVRMVVPRLDAYAQVVVRTG
jgi:hypothetical protein